MFVAQAHSFAQQARLAITLAWIAGYTNILTILTCGHVTSHVSGTTSDLGRSVAEGEWSLAAFAAFLLVTFLVGAMISGFVTELGRRRGWDSIYVLPMTIEALLLAAFAIGVEYHDSGRIETGAGLYAMTGVAAAAMGLQNATITRISSGVVRTTHVTGVLTDLGSELAQYLWYLRDHRRAVRLNSVRALLHELRAPTTFERLVLLASVLGSFALGACLGALAFVEVPSWSMFPPVVFLLLVIWQDLRLPIAEIEPSELVVDLGLDLPKSLAVFHLRKDRARRGPVHRMPNLLAWVGRLPPMVRVAILDVGDAAVLDPNSALELRAASRVLHAQGRHLIIAGLSPGQVEALRASAAGDVLEPGGVCPDLELAIARGLVLVDEPGPPPARAQTTPAA